MPKITQRTLRREAKRRGLVETDGCSATRESHHPVDRATFVAAFETFAQAIAEAPADAGKKSIRTVFLDGQRIELLDVPMNRAHIAANKYLAGVGVDDPAPYLSRIVALEWLISRERESLGDLLVEAENHIQLETTVIEAAATAAMIDDGSDDAGKFDVRSLLGIAHDLKRQQDVLS